MYADDTNIFISGNNINTLTDQCNAELDNISKYIQSNRLSLNTGKTQAMIFSTNPIIRNAQPQIVINRTNIDVVRSISFLGVKIDNSLTWTTHIAYISSKIAKSVGIIKKVSNVLNRNSLISLYTSLVVPYLNYCNLIWGNASTCHLNRIHLLQKKAVRTIYELPLCAHTARYFVQCNVLNIYDIYKLNCSIFLYKLINNCFPPAFNNEFSNKIFVFSSDVNFAIPTRTSTNNTLRLPRCRTTLRQKSLTYMSAKLFNEFLSPLALCESSLSVNCVKSNVTAILLATYT